MSLTVKWVIGIAVALLVAIILLVSVNTISSQGDDFIERNHIVHEG